MFLVKKTSRNVVHLLHEKIIFPFSKLSPLSYPIQCERKWKYSFLSEDWNFDITVREVFISHDDWGPR